MDHPSSTLILSSASQCTPCPADTFKANIGSWHTACTPCPSDNAGTQGEEVEPPPPHTPPQTFPDPESVPPNPWKIVYHLESPPPLVHACVRALVCLLMGFMRADCLLLPGLLFEFSGRVVPERVHLCTWVAGQPRPVRALLCQRRRVLPGLS